MAKEYRRISPLQELGGFVATMEPLEAIRLTLQNEHVLVAAHRCPNSANKVRLRIVAAKHIGLKRLSTEEVVEIIHLLNQGGKP